jgi:hypothetical protein
VASSDVIPVGALVKKLLMGPYKACREFTKLTFLPLIRPRRLDVCCCGLSKTGTHSMAGIFENYRSAHHPDGEMRLSLAGAFLKGEVDVAAAQRVLWRRDRLLWLEMESSSLAGILIDALSEACPRKKFVLTIRDVYSWCDSWIDQNINRPPTDSSPWAALDQIRLRVGDFAPTKFDSPLTARGFPPLACYFQLWANHNSRVLQAVPTDRLLLVKTGEIATKMQEIAAWAGAPLETLRTDRSWLFATVKKHRVLETLDKSYVRETADRFCGALMSEYFPEASWE